MSADQRHPTKPPRGRAPLDTLDKLDSLRPSSLPPELEEFDFSWDDDLAVQARANKPVFAPLELDLDLDEGDRPTAIPDMPMDEFVAHAMAQVDKEEQENAPPSSLPPFSSPGYTKPPTRPIERELSRPIQAYDPIPPLRSLANLAQVATPSAPPATQSHNPLTLDILDIDFQLTNPGSAPTEPPDPTPSIPTSMSTTLAPPNDDENRNTDIEEIGPATLPPHEDNSRPTMKDRYAMGDFSGALEIAESLLAADPSDLEAQRYATSCRDVLTQMFLSRLGGLDQIINVVLSPEELRWLNLDHRAGFLLSLVDGVSTIEELLDISGMSRLDALRILATLREQRAILLSRR